MPTIRRELLLSASPEAVWDVIREVGAVHTRLAPGFVTDTCLEPGARVVSFANGVVARELIVSLEEDVRRLVWSVVGGRATHHNSSLQVFAADGGAARLIWVTDLLPAEAAASIAAMVEAGSQVVERAFNAQRS